MAKSIRPPENKQFYSLQLIDLTISWDPTNLVIVKFI